MPHIHPDLKVWLWHTLIELATIGMIFWALMNVSCKNQ